jgi:signal transduction histidine kinase
MALFGFDEIADRLSTPLLLISLDGTIVGSNQAARHLLGATDRGPDLASRCLSDISVGPERAQELIRNWSRTTQRTPGSLTLRRADGKAVECRCSGSVVLKHGEETRHLLVEFQPKEWHPSQFQALNLRIEGLHKRLAGHAAVMEERHRLARELHDSVTQALYGVSLNTAAAGLALASGNSDAVAANLREIRETVQEAVSEMRVLLFELRPPRLEEDGLAGALEARLRSVEARAGLQVELCGERAVRLSSSMEQELYRIAQEALNNVLKHAHATRAQVQLDVSADVVCLQIQDNGIGFDPENAGGLGGFGLRGIRERVARLGGVLHVQSAPGEGTCVSIYATTVARA